MPTISQEQLCPQCSARFTPTRRSQRFCNVMCKTTYNNHHRNPVAKVCVGCEKPFLAELSRTRFCSKACAHSHREENFVVRSCKRCGSSFLFKGRSHCWYCGDCRIAVRKEHRDNYNAKRGVKVGVGSGGNQTGIYNHRWIAPELRKQPRAEPYRKKALEYWGRKCVVCGISTKPHVHHIDRDRRNNRVNNLVVLCESHHFLLHRKRGISNEECAELLFEIWPTGRSKIAELSENPQEGQLEPKAG